MFEIVEVDPTTGEEELLGTGSMQQLTALADEWNAEAEDEGRELIWFRIQPAA